MRWVKQIPESNLVGTRRKRLVFAWWPTKMSYGGVTVWLEDYILAEKFIARLGDRAIWDWVEQHKAPLP